MLCFSRRRPRAGATFVLLATTVLASTALAPHASAASPPPVGPGTTVYSGDGTAASDSGLHDGSWRWSPTYGEGASGAAGDQSFLFDGYGDQVLMDSDVAQFGRDPFAVSFKIRTTTSDFGSIMGARGWCTNTDDGWFDVRGGRTLGWEVGGDHYAGLSNPVVVNDGAWHTVDLRRTSTDISITVDGVTARAATPASSVHPAAAFGLDASPCVYADGTAPFTGELDDIRIGPLDVTAPVVAPLADRSVEAAGPSGAPVSWTASATDDTDPAPQVSCSPASGTTFPLGTTPVTCTATDGTGNVAQATFRVAVTDSTAPTLTLPAAVSSDATGPNGSPVEFTTAATDLVDGPVSPVCAPASGSNFVMGTTTVSCTATDAAGNVAVGSFTVTVHGAADQAAALVTLLQGYDGCSCAVQATQAYTSLQRGQLTAARGQLGAVRNSAAAAVRSGRISAAQGQAVSDAVARILATIG